MENIVICVLLQSNNHCREKHGWYISLQKIQARAMVPKNFLQAYSRMLHLKKKRRIREGHLTNITNKKAGKDRQCAPPDRYGFKICEKLTQLRWSKRHMWDNVTVLEEHISGTPLHTPSSWYTPGKFWTPWGVRYTRLTSTGLTDTFEGSYANSFRFGSQLYDFRFGGSGCTSIHTFLFIFSVLLYGWALGLAVMFRG